MPVTSDTPNDIYVRNIGDRELEAFQKIKNMFGYTSNNKTIQALFLKYLSQEEELKRVKQENVSLKNNNQSLESKLQTVKQFAKVLKSLKDD